MDPKMAASLRDMHIMGMDFEHPATMSVLTNALDDKLTFTPHERSKPFHEMFHHIYAAGPFFSSIIEQGKVNFDEGPKVTVPTTKAELASVCNELHQDHLKRIRAVSAEQLTTMVAFGSMPAIPAVMYLGWHINHLVHHRGQLTVYLRLMGAKVPSIYGGSADVPFNG